eukprot:CAMPEP_0194535088 /NCGR_PEP_ID=MMETSP0253-20130528/73510_1 /TAXON_ID=2966 /ORGANISM="Noctiluca scintillans" /LENGTH=187 /DNA_ID=CAMNT_0039380819 /DNA_START=283 /DNA_END=846 /DNA_ORIENTATION=-
MIILHDGASAESEQQSNQGLALLLVQGLASDVQWSLVEGLRTILLRSSDIVHALLWVAMGQEQQARRVHVTKANGAVDGSVTENIGRIGRRAARQQHPHDGRVAGTCRKHKRRHAVFVTRVRVGPRLQQLLDNENCPLLCSETQRGSSVIYKPIDTESQDIIFHGGPSVAQHCRSRFTLLAPNGSHS